VAVPIRVPKPEVPPGPRRVGLQAGHWRTDEVPDELRRLEHQTGTSGGGVAEWQLNLDVANRVATILRGYGYAADVLPTAIPPGYLADAFVALHADGDSEGSGRGYKAAHGARRGPYEDQLVRDLMDEYGRVTGLPVDPTVTRNMLGYYAFSWTRIKSSAAPHTPAAILEMGFLTSAADRAVLLRRPDLVATGVANGILRFLDEVPAGAVFADDLIVPPSPPPPFRPANVLPG
jgi:N-acetylmuramoyl-L-alanine amidase